MKELYQEIQYWPAKCGHPRMTLVATWDGLRQALIKIMSADKVDEVVEHLQDEADDMEVTEE